MGYSRSAAMRKMAKDIADGNSSLDRIEEFCRDNKIYSLWEFVVVAYDKAPDLAEWTSKSGRGVSARLRGINARIAKVKREARQMQLAGAKGDIQDARHRSNP